jgi:hypothetical protein
MTRIILGVLRQSTEPMTSSDIAVQLISERALDQTDATLQRLITVGKGQLFTAIGMLAAGWTRRVATNLAARLLSLKSANDHAFGIKEGEINYLIKRTDNRVPPPQRRSDPWRKRDACAIGIPMTRDSNG